MTGYIHIKAVEERDGTAIESTAELKNVSFVNKAQILAAAFSTLGIDVLTENGAEKVAILIAAIRAMKSAGDFEEKAYGIRF